MSLKDITKRNEYMNSYMSDRYRTRREEFLVRLGGKCVKCGSTTALELDHINPKDKKLSWRFLATASKGKIEAEIIKCQLLCKPCHIEKTVLERGQQLKRGTHGTISSYRYCGPPKCEECRAVKREYNLHKTLGR